MVAEDWTTQRNPPPQMRGCLTWILPSWIERKMKSPSRLLGMKMFYPVWHFCIFTSGTLFRGKHCDWYCAIVDILLMKCRWHCLLCFLSHDSYHYSGQLPNSVFLYVYIYILQNRALIEQLSKEWQETRGRRGRHATKVTLLIQTGDFAVMF